LQAAPDVDWSAAATVAGMGLAGVFVTLTLLFLTTLLYGAAIHKMEQRKASEDKETTS
jgi:Na+-transporting methylmalonyl-CoA/oxaloacetate decarboxylase gamma subunit